MKVPLLCVVAMFGCALPAGAQTLPEVRNALGVRLVVAEEDTQPVLKVALPDEANWEAIRVLFPEHVTVKKVGASDGEHLYLFQAGMDDKRPVWRQVGQAIEYERVFKPGI